MTLQHRYEQVLASIGLLESQVSAPSPPLTLTRVTSTSKQTAALKRLERVLLLRHRLDRCRLRRAWRQWRRHVKRTVQSDVLQCLVHRKDKSRKLGVLLTWKTHAQATRARDQLAIWTWRRRTLAVCLRAWRRELVAVQVAHLRARQRLARAWAAWRRVLARGQVVVEVGKRRIARAFHAWRLETRARVVQQQRLRRVLVAWQGAARHRLDERVAQQAHDTVLLSRTWRVWRKVRVEQLQVKAASWRRGWLLASAWDRWQHARTARRVAAQYNRRKAFRAWRAWTRYSRDHHRWQHWLSGYVDKRRRQRAALHVWLSLTRDAQASKLTLAAAHHRRHLLARSMSALTYQAQLASSRRQYYDLQYRHALLQAAWRSWRRALPHPP